MESFITRLFNEIVENLRNDYSDNYDIDRFGKEPKKKMSLKTRLFSVIKKKKYVIDDDQIKRFQGLDKYYDRMEQVYGFLNDDESKKIYVKLIAYRILGHRKVKLPLNTPEYQNKKVISDRYKINDDFIETPFVDNKTIKLYKYDLTKENILLKMYAADVYPLLFIEQYENDEVKVEIGDVLLDCGGCWGDTSLIFANKVGEMGHIYSFEFIPDNIEIFKRNLALNENISSRLTIVQNAIGEKSGELLSFSNNGPGSRVENKKTNSNLVKTITIDDFVTNNKISKVDFIKMDIEGSELPSLKGASNVLKRFRPKLAISIYHSIDDFVNIPIYLKSLNLGYQFFIKHGTIHNEETVLLAISK